MCAFDLLATVAGKLLLDGENPQSANTSSGKEQPVNVGNSVGKEEKDVNKSLEENSCERDCYERNFLFTEIVSEAPNPNSCSNELACTQNDIISRPASGITSSDCSEKIGSAEQLVNDDCKLSLGISTPSVDIESSGFRLSANSGSEDESRKDIKPDSANIRNLSISNKVSLCSSGYPEASDRKSSALVCSVDSVKFPFCRDPTPCGSFPINRENVKLVSRDDDENSSECIEPSTRNKAFKPPGDRRFRKLLAPKHCKITSNAKDDEGFTGELLLTVKFIWSMLSLYYSISLICVQKDAIISAGRMVSSAKGLSGIILSKRGSFMTAAQFQILMTASPVMECLECPKMVLMKMDLDLFQHCQEVVLRLVFLQLHTYNLVHISRYTIWVLDMTNI